MTDDRVGPAPTFEELLAALSLATDLGMGAPLEEGLAVCVLAVRFAEELGLPPEDVERVRTASLLRHIGCTAETAELASFLGAASDLLAHPADAYTRRLLDAAPSLSRLRGEGVHRA